MVLQKDVKGLGMPWEDRWHILSGHLHPLEREPAGGRASCARRARRYTGTALLRDRREWALAVCFWFHSWFQRGWTEGNTG